MGDTVKLLSLAVAVPEHVITQTKAAEASARLFSSRFTDFRHLAGVFDNAGITRRYAARPLSWFDEPHGWQDRLEAYPEVASSLFVEAATKALRRADLKARDVDCVVTISSTGFTTPSLDAQLAGKMGFRSDIEGVVAGIMVRLILSARFRLRMSFMPHKFNADR